MVWKMLTPWSASANDDGVTMTAGAPLVSVIIPAYNARRFVGEAIDSVLRQTMNDLEIIVVDDGSTDTTPVVLADFGSAIRVHRQANGGVASARNAGVATARGTYVAFLDADDVWLPEKLARQMPLFERSDVALVYSGIRVVDADLRLVRDIVPAAPERALINTLCVEPPPVPLTMTGVVRRTAFDAVGGFDERLSTSADADFVCRVAARYRLERIEEPLALYRQHSAQMHLDLEAMERDMNFLQAMFFAGAGPYTTLRSRAVANLYSTLAFAYVRDRRPGTALRCAAKAVRSNAPRFLHLLWAGVCRHIFRVAPFHMRFR